MFCRNCGLDLPDDSKFCVRCGKPCLPPPPPAFKVPRRLIRWGIFAAACPLAVAFTALATRSYRDISALRSAAIYRDAVEHARNSAALQQLAGGAVRATGFVVGYARASGDGGSGLVITPLLTPAGLALLHAQLYRSAGVWRYSSLQVTVPGRAGPLDLLQPPADDLAELHTNGRLYVIAMGSVSTTPLPPLAEYLEKKFAVPVTVLPALPLDESVMDLHRNQVKAEEVFAALKRAFPKESANGDNTIIAVTESDMYAQDWVYAFNYWDRNLAVISTNRLNPHFSTARSRDALLRSRMHKVLERDMGLLFYKLPLSDDPTSVLYRNLDDVTDVDMQRESLSGSGSLALVAEYPATTPVPPLQPILRKAVAESAPRPDEYACLVFTPSPAGSAQLLGKLQTCRPPWTDSVPVERYEIDLRGRFALHETDLFLPDSMPLSLTRTYHSWGIRSAAFGIGSTHPYDIVPLGSRSPYTYIQLMLADGSYVYYPRVSAGAGFRDALYQETNTTGRFYNSQIRWNGDGWDLRFSDGSLVRFPEAYWARNLEQGAAIEMRSPTGEAIRFTRDPAMRLVTLTSPHQRQIRFSYDAGERIVQAASNDGHTMDYVYDPGGRLARIARDGKPYRRYTYESTYLLTVEDGAGIRLLVNKYYDNGRIEQITLADGSAWHFRYTFGPHRSVTAVEITDPAGRRARITLPRPIPEPG